jgi:hypothetical protein
MTNEPPAGRLFSWFVAYFLNRGATLQIADEI